MSFLLCGQFVALGLIVWCVSRNRDRETQLLIDGLRALDRLHIEHRQRERTLMDRAAYCLAESRKILNRSK